LNWYTVKRGDTLALIAKKLHVSRTDLAGANYLSLTARVAVGQRLLVPLEVVVLLAARSDRAALLAESRATLGNVGPLMPSSSSNRVKATYEVKRGDTLSSIARLFSTSVVLLKNWNPRINGDRLAPGQRLTVYGPG
jgi:LysM repeat protein